MISFELLINVAPSDLDELDHVNNVVYVQWVQDVAKAHWESLTSEAIRKENVWMVLRHEIDYLGQAMEGDALIAKTWVSWSEGVKSERCVEITNKSSGKKLIQAKTLWCLLDGTTKKPRRIGDEIKKLFHG